MTRFKDLKIGDVFEFSDRQLGMAQGPWVKISECRYLKLGQSGGYKVGTVIENRNVEVDRLGRLDSDSYLPENTKTDKGA